jgi:Putative peptidoglycan binding domain
MRRAPLTLLTRLRPWRTPRWLASRRAKALTGTGLAVAAALVVLLVANPFAGPSAPTSGVTDNSYKTTTQKVIRGNLASQSTVSATLGYSGNYTVSIPSGATSDQVNQAQTALASAQAKVADDERTLADANSLNATTGDANLISAQAAVSSDETTLAQAQAQLTQDEHLGCPPASSATVTSPAASAGSGSNSPSSGTGQGAHDSAGTQAPTATTGQATDVSTTSATLTGTLTPNGGATSYYFEYGTTPSFGATSPSRNAGSGSQPIDVSATISGLSPDTTYRYELVATNAAGTTIGSIQTLATTQSSCVAQRQVVSQDQTTLAEARSTLAADRMGSSSTLAQDRQQLALDRMAASAAAQALTLAQSQQTNPSNRFTALPAAGKIIRRGQSVYSLDNHPVPLFYGSATPYRALYVGVADGPDVTVLNDNLAALGFGAGLSSSPHFSAATEAAVRAWQASIGETPTGVVSLGDYVVKPGAIRVTSLGAALGAATQPGSPVLSASSTSRVVTIALDASQQSEVRVGDQVQITLPNNRVTPGVVSSVGSVATTPNSNNGGSGSPTITVQVKPTDPRATGTFDQAPVTVSITQSSVRNVLIVPVDALLSLASGGDAVEVVGSNGVHQLVAVTTGLFDDATGQVQVSGAGLAVGEKVVVPAL